MIYTIVLCLFVLFLSFIISKNNLFSPGVLTAGIWLFCLGLFLLLKHNLPNLSLQFLGSLSLWITCISLFSGLMQSCHFSKVRTKPSMFIRNLYLLISVFSFPFFLHWVYVAIHSGDTASWTTNLRLAAIGQSSVSTEVYGGLHIIVWQISYLMELFYFNKKNWWRLFIPAAFYIAFAFFTMSKAAFLSFFVSSICILYFKRIISFKHILIGALSLFVLFIGIQTVRFNTNLDSEGAKNDFLVLYLLSGMSAFDTLIPASSSHFGENVFRFYYAIAYKLGFSQIEPINVLLPWIHKPILTNTYTGMYPFFKDFGYWGIIFSASLIGVFMGWLFKKAKQGSPQYIILYAYFSVSLIMQYAADMFFTTLSGNLKFILLLCLPFIAEKYGLFVKREKATI